VDFGIRTSRAGINHLLCRAIREGKTTLVHLAGGAAQQQAASAGMRRGSAPMNVIYQTAEDGLADTIKPRLTRRARTVPACRSSTRANGN
jgi:hypothetical protein